MRNAKREITSTKDQESRTLVAICSKRTGLPRGRSTYTT